MSISRFKIEISLIIQHKNTDIILKVKFNNRPLNSNTKANNTMLVLLNANFLGYGWGWVRERKTNKALT